MNNDLPWFRHEKDARNTPAAKALRAAYGFDGYGRYMMLLEILADEPGARLDLSLKKNRAGYSIELGMKPDEFDNFLVFLSNPEECGLIHYEDGIVWSDDIDHDYGKVEAKRERRRESYQSGQPVDDRNDISDDRNDESDGTIDTRAEKTRLDKRSSAAREGLPVDKSEEASLAAFALERAKKTQGVKNPGAYARKLQDEPDVIAAWREALRNPPPPPEPKLPPPGDCPTCGGQRWRYPGDTYDVCTCTRCGVKARWDADWKIWGPVDDHAHEFENSA